MSEHHSSQPVAEGYAGDGDLGAGWIKAMEELQKASTFWLATTHPTGRPHVVPVLAVVSGDALHFAAGPGTRKARNLARDQRLTLTTQGDDLDVVIEGEAHTVRDTDALTDVAAVYLDKYGWDVDVLEGRLHAEGAPTAGPPPYDVYRLTPHRAFGFPSTGAVAPTRWRFEAPDHQPGG